jgi:hypothetical protein
MNFSSSFRCFERVSSVVFSLIDGCLHVVCLFLVVFDFGFGFCFFFFFFFELLFSSEDAREKHSGSVYSPSAAVFERCVRFGSALFL